MMRALTVGVLIFAAWPVLGMAEEWRVLDGSAIKAALEGQSLNYGDASQNFEADGLTVYFADAPSSGQWRVDGDAYCSLWPPAETWDCYRVEGKDGAIRFVAPDGQVTQGTFMD